ncbi:hypothetical protein Pfo_012970 [Paulownia fortunei]|nr:hypothetical protein Pfo_012970 [Paulownia fortunei]
MLTMEQIEHKYVQVDGLKLHMIAVAKAGFRAIAPDYRGYGLSDPPPEPDKATFSDFVANILALLDAFSLQQAFLVAKDFGVRVAYFLALLHPEKVSGIVTFCIPYLSPTQITFYDLLPEGFYMSRWLKPGRAEADFGRLDSKTVVRNIYILFSRSEIPIAHENQEIMDMVDSSTPLPPWFTDEDLATYASLYEKSVEAPALLVVGEKDYFFKYPGVEDYIKSEQAKKFFPKLETIYEPEGSHFVQEQFPEQMNQLMLNFLSNHN